MWIKMHYHIHDEVEVELENHVFDPLEAYAFQHVKKKREMFSRGVLLCTLRIQCNRGGRVFRLFVFCLRSLF